MFHGKDRKKEAYDEALACRQQALAVVVFSRILKFYPVTFVMTIESMETSTVIICAVSIIIGLGSIYLYAYFKDKKSMEKLNPETASGASSPLKLQAYERLVLLCDRIALPNLVSRMNQPGLSAKEAQLLLTQTVKQEFEHNITQQIYVSPEAWQAIRNLKEQNILIINQVASFLPQNATGADLNRALMDLLIENPSASLHNIVSDALSFEARKLL